MSSSDDDRSMTCTLFKDWLINWEHVHVNHTRSRSGGSLDRKALMVHSRTLPYADIQRVADDLNYTCVGVNEVDIVGGPGSACSFDNTDRRSPRRPRPRHKIVLVLRDIDDHEETSDEPGEGAGPRSLLTLEHIATRIATSQQPIVMLCNNEYFQEAHRLQRIVRQCHVLETESRPVRQHQGTQNTQHETNTQR